MTFKYKCELHFTYFFFSLTRKSKFMVEEASTDHEFCDAENCGEFARFKIKPIA